MLEQECAAVAAYIGALLSRSPLHEEPLLDAPLDLFVSHLTRSLQAMVSCLKKRVRDEVQTGRRAIAVSVQVPTQDSLIALAADSAGIDAIGERLAFASAWTPKMFAGYVTVREGEQMRVLYPDIQAPLDAIEEAFSRAKQTPHGLFLSATCGDCQSVVLEKSYPAYYVYELKERPVAEGAWQSVERTGRDHLVALLAHAYHQEHWFVRQSAVAWRVR